MAITDAILSDKLDSSQPNLNPVFLLEEEELESDDGLELLFKIGDFDTDEDDKAGEEADATTKHPRWRTPSLDNKLQKRRG